MTKRQAAIRILLWLAAVSLFTLGRGLNSRPAGVAAVSIMLGAWLWTALMLKAQRRHV
jgi:hypothetical protein